MKSKKELDYLDIIYDPQKKPFTSYPSKLAKFLFDKYNLKKNHKFLDIGCGRGEFLKGFINCGVNGFAVDKSDTVLKYLPDVSFQKSDIENEGIPYPDNFFDVVFSKSVIEHFYNPDKLVNEMYRVLKPGGIAITLCPSWEHNYRIYFEDYTHRTPFMLKSLKDIKLINGFIEVEAEYFRQLPIVWKIKKLIFFAEITRILLPHFTYTLDSTNPVNKWIRFSKEIMLLSSGRKPRK